MRSRICPAAAAVAAVAAAAVLAVLAAGCCPPPSTLPARIAACRRVLLEQQAAWNRGDIDAFARGYLRSPRLVFASKSHLSLGYQGMLARYRKRYPDRAAMGRLAFSSLRFVPVDGETISVHGRWQLHREREARTRERLGGAFVLIMRRVGSTWRVAIDYTTVDSAP
ncbi:MAG: nuclear transport factor 2 family protein [Myxococcales bacterium]|nr:nuclear transport factor 2 family protein [Myxococcales bacterium]